MTKRQAGTKNKNPTIRWYYSITHHNRTEQKPKPKPKQNHNHNHKHKTGVDNKRQDKNNIEPRQDLVQEKCQVTVPSSRWCVTSSTESTLVIQCALLSCVEHTPFVDTCEWKEMCGEQWRLVLTLSCSSLSLTLNPNPKP